MKIDVTEEQYYNFMKGENIELVPPKKEHVIEYNKPWEINCIHEPKQLDFNIKKTSALYTLGELRKTKENIIYKQKRNQRANRLEALVEDLQGELGVGGCSVYEKDGCYRSLISEDYTIVGVVRMKEETAKKVCELLNSKPAQYSLEG